MPPDLHQTIDDLKGLPDQALQHELMQPSGAVPGYLVLAEAQRRQLMRSAAQKSQQQQSGTVYDDVIRGMMARQPPPGPPAPVGMAPAPSSPGTSTLGAPPPPGNFQAPKMMAIGGAVGTEDDSYDDVINDAALKNNLDPELLRAVRWQESRGRNRAVSGKGAIGPMQLMPDTARELGVDPHDPVQNIYGGARYLRQKLDQNNQDQKLALAAYNAGQGAVKKYGGIPPFPETQNYVQRITARLTKKKGALPGRPDLLPKGPMQVMDESGEERPLGTAFMPAARPGALPSGPMEVMEEGGDEHPIGTKAFTPPPDAAAEPSAPADLPEPPAPAAAAAPDAEPPSSPPAAAADNTWKLNLPGRVAPMVRPPAVSTEPSVAERYFTDSQKDLRKEIEQLKAAALKESKPNFWQALSDFGFGMAASPSPFFGVQIGAGGQAMNKAMRERQDQARRNQLELLGVDLKLDDQARLHQEKIDALHQKAVDQAQKTQDDKFKMVVKSPGAVVGPASQPPGDDYIYTPHPSDPSYGVWALPGQLPVTKELIPHLGTNPATGQPYTTKDVLPATQILQARKDAEGVTKKGLGAKPTATDLYNATGVNQTFAAHPDLALPVGPDGSPRDPSTLRAGDLPTEELRKEAIWRARIAKDGWSKKNIDGVLGDKDAPVDLKATAQATLKNQAVQAGTLTTARVAATGAEKQKQAAQAPMEFSTAGANQMREQSVVGTQFDNLIDRLEHYKTDNNPMTLLGPLGKYKLGMVTPEGQLGNDLSSLSLATIQGMMPFASKSRNYNFIKDIEQHLPKIMSVPPDSPANIYDKLIKARRNFLRMDRATMQYELKKTGTNAPAPRLDEKRAMVYVRLAGGDYEKAGQMAKEDGWQVEE